MADSTEILRLRTLLYFANEKDKACSVTNIARTLGEEKYLISRMLIALEKEGMVDRSVSRMPVLTALGQQTAKRYAERVDVIMNHLIYEGVSADQARGDALYFALYSSDDSMEIFQAAEERYRVKYELREQKIFSGSTLCKKMKDGVYAFPFLIYREHIKNNSNLSMANGGFHQPCTLSVKNGVGTVQLHIRDVKAKSGEDGNAMTGHVQNLRYFVDGRYVKAEINGNILSFQAAALNFINIGSGVGQVLHGSVCLEMECTVGTRHMPQSKAIFTVLI